MRAHVGKQILIPPENSLFRNGTCIVSDMSFILLLLFSRISILIISLIVV